MEIIIRKEWLKSEHVTEFENMLEELKVDQIDRAGMDEVVITLLNPDVSWASYGTVEVDA